MYKYVQKVFTSSRRLLFTQKRRNHKIHQQLLRTLKNVQQPTEAVPPTQVVVTAWSFEAHSLHIFSRWNIILFFTMSSWALVVSQRGKKARALSSPARKRRTLRGWRTLAAAAFSAGCSFRLVGTPASWCPPDRGCSRRHQRPASSWVILWFVASSAGRRAGNQCTGLLLLSQLLYLQQVSWRCWGPCSSASGIRAASQSSAASASPVSASRRGPRAAFWRTPRGVRSRSGGEGTGCFAPGGYPKRWSWRWGGYLDRTLYQNSECKWSRLPQTQKKKQLFSCKHRVLPIECSL